MGTELATAASAPLTGVLLALAAALLLAVATGVQAYSRSRSAWWAGTALLGVGSGLGALALVLAPVALVQPVGVLALPLAVAWAARTGRAPAGLAGWVGVVCCLLGVAALVVLLTPAAGAGGAATVDLAGPGTVVLALVALAAATGSVLDAGPGRTVLLAAAAGTAFGTVAALTRTVLPALLDGRAPALDAGLVLALALGLGLWSLHRAGSDRHHGLLVATLTVVDPLIAVALAGVLLGETLPGGQVGLGAGAAALLAVVGVVVLAATGSVPGPERAAGRSSAPTPHLTHQEVGGRRTSPATTDGVLG